VHPFSSQLAAAAGVAEPASAAAAAKAAAGAAAAAAAAGEVAAGEAGPLYQQGYTLQPVYSALTPFQASDFYNTKSSADVIERALECVGKMAGACVLMCVCVCVCVCVHACIILLSRPCACLCVATVPAVVLQERLRRRGCGVARCKCNTLTPWGPASLACCRGARGRGPSFLNP